jgi:outer membrane protein assembly factor BamE (lipoprotein component of BamABCDE complex)
MGLSVMRSNKTTAGLRFGGAILAIGLSIFVAGCAEEQFNRGYVIDNSLLSQIKVGSSAEQVVLVLGTPSTVSTVGGQTYYYISQRASRSFAFQNPSVSDQQVVAIYLNKGNRVDKIANYGLQDGVVFDFVSRTTPSGGEETSFLRQLFGLLGSTPQIPSAGQ